jgi:hypothetical protein
MNITKKRLILCNITNGIIALRKHVFTNHFIIVKMFEKEMNIPLKEKQIKSLLKRDLIYLIVQISSFCCKRTFQEK